MANQIDPVLPLAFALHSCKGAYAILLGSGISRAASIPTGWDIVLDLIRQVAHVCEEDCGTDPEGWYKARYEEEARYDKLLEHLAKTPAERSQLLHGYFEPTEEERAEGKKTPTKAHHAIAELISKGYIRVVVTTNFDRLLEEALAAKGFTPRVVSTAEEWDHALPLAHSPCTIIKVHGDYLATTIRNTPEELANYDGRMNDRLRQVFDEYGLIVCGWSADWDVALRTRMTETLSHRFTTYWAARGKVSDIAEECIASRWAQVIAISDADSFFVGLADKVKSLEDMAQQGPTTAAVASATVKRYLAVPAQRIRLRDLCIGEAQRLSAELAEDEYGYPQSGEQLLERLQQYEDAIAVLRAMLIAGCYWAPEEEARLWAECISLIASAPPSKGQRVRYTTTRLYPALHLLYAAGVAGVAHGIVGPITPALRHAQVRDFEGLSAIIGTVWPEKVVEKHILNDVQKTQMFVPLSEQLYKVLREPLRSYLPLDEDYTHAFDLFEYWFGLLTADTLRYEHTIGLWGPTGAFGWRYKRLNTLPVADDVFSEMEGSGAEWRPFSAGCFGGSVEQFRLVHDRFNQHVRVVSQQWF